MKNSILALRCLMNLISQVASTFRFAQVAHIILDNSIP